MLTHFIVADVSATYPDIGKPYPLAVHVYQDISLLEARQRVEGYYQREGFAPVGIETETTEGT